MDRSRSKSGSGSWCARSFAAATLPPWPISNRDWKPLWITLTTPWPSPSNGPTRASRCKAAPPADKIPIPTTQAVPKRTRAQGPSSSPTLGDVLNPSGKRNPSKRLASPKHCPPVPQLHADGLTNLRRAVLAKRGLEPRGHLQAEFHLRLLGEQVAPEDDARVSRVNLTGGRLLVEVIVVAPLVVVPVLPAEGDAPPRRSVEARPEVLEFARRIRFQQVRGEATRFLGGLANSLLLEASFRKEGGERNLRIAKPRNLAERRAVKIPLNKLREHRAYHGRQGWVGGRQRQIVGRVPEALLAGPFVLRSQRESQALPRAEQGAEAEHMRIPLQLDSLGVPPRGRCRRRSQVDCRDIYRGIAVELAIEVTA